MARITDRIEQARLRRSVALNRAQDHLRTALEATEAGDVDRAASAARMAYGTLLKTHDHDATVRHLEARKNPLA